MKMPRSERAKQFMPFSALKGLEEALAEREKVITPKKELAEDMAAELNRKLYLLREKRNICLTYFCDGDYRQVSGQAVLDQTDSTLKIGTQKVALADILTIEISNDKTVTNDVRL